MILSSILVHKVGTSHKRLSNTKTFQLNIQTQLRLFGQKHVYEIIQM